MVFLDLPPPTITSQCPSTFDFSHSGQMDQIIIYLPGNRVDPPFHKIGIFRNNNGTFQLVVQNPNLSYGIGGDTFSSVIVQILAFDLDGKGRTDCLVVHDLGSSQIIIANHRGNDFSYSKSGTKPYVHLMHKYNFNPAKEGPYFIDGRLEHTGRPYTDEAVGGHAHVQQVFQKKAIDSDQVGEADALDVQDDTM
ncbi:hypothetical protein BJY01DRAFT_244849 [Aspergillus pseudoustus]|uniref:Uncharacterized protein n=1 Tax=Aspergillus pseudoustus TaxID=1810923 RepID=A0ABR4KI08_9EURO